MTAPTPPRTERWLAWLVGALFLLFPIALNVSNVALLLLLVTWVLMLRDPTVRQRLLREPMVWLFAALYGVVCLGLLWTPDGAKWVDLHLSKYARLLYAIVLIGVLVGREQLQALALNMFALAMLFILASTWLNVWFLLPWSASQNLGWGVSHHVFGDYITQNVMMAFFVVLAAHWARLARVHWQRLAWGGVAVAAAVSITHLSLGRTGLVGLVAALLTYLLVAVRGRALGWTLGAAVVVLAVLWASSGLMQGRFALMVNEAQRHEQDNTSSIGHRLYNYTITPQLIAERPWLGHGTGAYHTEICRFVAAPTPCELFGWHPHNQFLFLGADHGLLGMLLYALLIGGLYRTAWRSHHPVARPMLAVLASLLLADSLINSPLWSSRESQFFMYLAGLLISMATSQARPRTPR